MDHVDIMYGLTRTKLSQKPQDLDQQKLIIRSFVRSRFVFLAQCQCVGSSKE